MYKLKELSFSKEVVECGRTGRKEYKKIKLKVAYLKFTKG